MKKIFGILALLVLTLGMNTMAFANADTTVPTYQNPAGKHTFYTSTTVVESPYVIFEWHMVQDDGTDTIVATHKYTNTTREWFQSDKYTTDALNHTVSYYCKIRDRHTDDGGYTNATNTERVNILKNFTGNRIELPAGFKAKITVQTDPVEVRDGLVTDLTWWRNYASKNTTQYERVRGQKKWSVITPINGRSTMGDKYFLRVTTYDDELADNDPYRDTRPVTVDVLLPVPEKCWAEQERDIYDGQRYVGNDVRLHIYFKEDVILEVVPEDDAVTFDPAIATVGDHTIPIVYTDPAGDVIPMTVDLHIKDPIPTTPLIEDRVVTDIKATYVGSGTIVEHYYQKSDFEVYIKFKDVDVNGDGVVDDQDWERTNTFNLHLPYPEAIGENTVTVEYVQDRGNVSTTCTTIGLEDTERMNTITGITATYDDAYIVVGQDYDPNKLHVTAHTVGNGDKILHANEYEVQTDAVSGIYIITSKYQGFTDTISLPIKTASITSLSAVYNGVVPVGMPIERDKLSGTITFEDGTEEDIKGSTLKIEDYLIREGDNTLTVHYNELTAKPVVKGINIDLITINDPAIYVTSDPTRVTSESMRSILDKSKIGVTSGTSMIISGMPRYVDGKIEYDADNTLLPATVTIQDNKTNQNNSTDIYYDINNCQTMLYKTPMDILTPPGIITVKAKAVYANLVSNQIVKTVYIDKEGNIKDIKANGIIAIYNGPDVDANNKINEDYLDVYVTFDGTDYVLPIDDYEIEPYTIKPGKNTLTVKWSPYVTEFTVNSKIEYTPKDTEFNPTDYQGIAVTAKETSMPVGTDIKKSDLIVKVKTSDGFWIETQDYTLTPVKLELGLNEVFVKTGSLTDKTIIYGYEGSPSGGSSLDYDYIPKDQTSTDDTFIVHDDNHSTKFLNDPSNKGVRDSDSYVRLVNTESTYSTRPSNDTYEAVLTDADLLTEDELADLDNLDNLDDAELSAPTPDGQQSWWNRFTNGLVDFLRKLLGGLFGVFPWLEDLINKYPVGVLSFLIILAVLLCILLFWLIPILLAGNILRKEMHFQNIEYTGEYKGQLVNVQDDFVTITLQLIGEFAKERTTFNIPIDLNVDTGDTNVYTGSTHQYSYVYDKSLHKIIFLFTIDTQGVTKFKLFADTDKHTHAESDFINTNA